MVKYSNILHSLFILLIFTFCKGFKLSKFKPKNIFSKFILGIGLTINPLNIPLPGGLNHINSALAFTDDENKLVNIFSTTTPSVAYISTYQAEMNLLGMQSMEVPQGTGSGFVWDKEGHIVTNYHVIRNSDGAKVTLTGKDGKASVFDASIRGVDPDKDIAVICVDDPEAKKLLVPIPVGTSQNLKVGQTTLAIGNPFGLDHTLTTGIVSGLSRSLQSPTGRPISNVIQTDAAINPGNSGGPLLDSSGKLIGMNTAIFTLSGASAGIGFAIPSDMVKYEVDAIIRDGEIIRPAIGISYLDSSRAKTLGIDKGVLIIEVPRGSDAEKSGLIGTSRFADGTVAIGDIIVGMSTGKNGDGEISPINTENDLFKCLEGHTVGDVVKLNIIRREKIDGSGFFPSSKEVLLKLGNRSSQYSTNPHTFPSR